MAECPSDDAVKAAVDSTANTMSMPGPTTQGPDLPPEAPERALLEEDQAAHTVASSQVAQAIDANNSPGEAVSPADNKKLRRVRDWLSKVIDAAEKGKQSRLGNIRDILYQYSDATTAKRSWWYTAAKTMRSWFDDEAAAAFGHWAGMNVHFKDRTMYNNPLAQEYELAQSKTQAYMREFTTELDNIASMLHPHADRAGMPTKDLAQELGHYALYRNVRERNAIIEQRLEAAINKEVQAKTPNHQLIRQYWKRLDAHRNSMNNPTRPSNPDERWDCGYTNAEADLLMERVLQHTGVSKEVADEFSDKLVGFFRRVIDKQAAEGVLHPQQVEAFPDMEQFIPFKTRFESSQGAINDTLIYRLPRYYRIEGTNREEKPDSGWFTAMQYARRASLEMGNKDLADALAVAAKVAERQGRDIGIRLIHEGQLIAYKRGKDDAKRALAMNIENRGGLMANVPVFKDGKATDFKRMYVVFDDTWVDPETGTTGAELNRALKNQANKPNFLAKNAMRATSAYGQSFTRFTATFAPINCLYDSHERFITLSNRDYIKDDGSTIPGYKLMWSYAKNVPRAAELLMKTILAGKEIDPTSTLGRQWQEYNAYGLHQDFTWGKQDQPKTLDELIASRDSKTLLSPFRKQLQGKDLRAVQATLNRMGRTKDRVISVIDRWNDTANNIASFAHFITLRDAGVSLKSAAHGTLEPMNLYHSGGAVGKYLKILYPFTKPALQSGAAAMRTMGFAPDPRKGYVAAKRGSVTMAGAMMAMYFLKDFSRESLGQHEETGEYYYDWLPMSTVQRVLPIGFSDGTYAKYPMGYGPIQMAATLAIGADRVARGIMTPEDLATEMVYTWVKNMMPGNWPEYDMSEKPLEWMFQAFSPALLSGFTEVATNTAWHGGDLTTARRGGTTSMADQGSYSTPDVYHKMAKSLQTTWGIEAAPEQVEAVIDHFTPGPLLGVVRKHLIEADAFYKTSESRAEDDLHPFINAMGGTRLYGKAIKVEQRAFYTALDELNQLIKESGISLKSSDYGNDKSKRDAYYRAQLAKTSLTPEQIDDFMLLDAATRELKSLRKERSAGVRNTWLSSDSSDEVRAALTQLALDEADIYTQAVTRLHRYNP